MCLTKDAGLAVKVYVLTKGEAGRLFSSDFDFFLHVDFLSVLVIELVL